MAKSTSGAWIVFGGAMQMSGSERPDLIFRFILIKSDLLPPPIPEREA